MREAKRGFQGTSTRHTSIPGAGGSAEPPLVRIAHTPPVTVAPDASVRAAVDAMVENRVGAVAVVDADGRIQGIFTERDLMVKVAAQGRAPEEVRVGEVMVTPLTAAPDMRRSEALDLMITRHFRHLPITDHDGRLLGMLSIRHLLQHQLGRMVEERDALEQYLAADGPGG